MTRQHKLFYTMNKETFFNPTVGKRSCGGRELFKWWVWPPKVLRLMNQPLKKNTLKKNLIVDTVVIIATVFWFYDFNQTIIGLDRNKQQ